MLVLVLKYLASLLIPFVNSPQQFVPESGQEITFMEPEQSKTEVFLAYS